VSSIGLDFHSIVLPVVGSDGFADWIEIVLLVLSVDNVPVESDMSSTVALNNSLHWKSRDNVERSIDMESEFFIETFFWNWFSFIKIDNIPSLVCSIMSLPGNNSLSFNILCS
jgi:hypothetical protein